MNYAKKAVSASKPGEFGFPYGDFKVQLMKVVEDEREGKGGVEQTYFDWYLLLSAKRHESAQGTIGSIVKVSLSWSQTMGQGHNTAFGAAFAGKTFEAFQGLEEKVINAYFAELQDEAKQVDKKRSAILVVKPRIGSDHRVYRDYTIHPVDAPPAEVYVFDPKSAESPTEGATAAAEAGKGTASKPPTSGL